MCIYVTAWQCYFFWYTLLESVAWGLATERETIDSRSTKCSDTSEFIFIKLLFPWAQEESNSRRQWVCWCCRMQCSTEIPSLNRLGGMLGNCGAAAAQSTTLDHHINSGLHANSLRLSKSFFFIYPWFPDCSAKVKVSVMEACWSMPWCCSQCAKCGKGSGSSRGRAACPCSLQSSQAAQPGLNSRLLQESTSFLSQSGSSHIWVLFYI